MNTAATKSVSSLESLCHVVETKGEWSLVHAAPASLAEIVALGFSIHPSKKGGNYYAVKSATPAPSGTKLSVAPPAAKPAPKAKPAPAAQSALPSRVEIKGTDYALAETATKRKMDCRRFEVRKLGDELAKPYVVSFQSHDGHTAQCSCPDWIYRRRQCKHITAVQAVAVKAPVADVA